MRKTSLYRQPLGNSIPIAELITPNQARLLPQSTLLYQLFVDLEKMSEFLRSERFGIHNHNLIMAKSLILFTQSFPFHPKAKEYYSLAKDVLLAHLEQLYEPDMFIREQSTGYHHQFINYFLDFYSVLAMNDGQDQAFPFLLRSKIGKMIAVDAVMAFPDGGSVVPTGDTGPCSLENELELMLLRYKGICGPETNDIPRIEFAAQPKLAVFRDSGWYIFRDIHTRRMLMVDISKTRQAHGHYDCGNFLYFAEGQRLLQDAGGPYKYASSHHRAIASSRNHSVMMPDSQSMMAGRAFAVNLQDKGEEWVLSFRSNVYGPKFLWCRKFVVAKDLSAFTVVDEMDGPSGAGYSSRVVLAPNLVMERRTRREFLIKKGNAQLIVSGSADMDIEPTKVSFATNIYEPSQNLIIKSKACNRRLIQEMTFKLMASEPD